MDKAIPVFDPFLLDTESKQKPCVFELYFVAPDQQHYCYKVAVEKYKVDAENLKVVPIRRKTTRSILLYDRIGTDIYFGESYKGKRDFSLNENQLLLSQAGISAINSLTPVYRFFSKYLFSVPVNDTFDEQMLAYAGQILELTPENQIFIRALNSIIRAADTGISKIWFFDN